MTHIHWRLVAPRLAEQFTVVATDLRGYGDSGKPRGLPDHSNYSFRRMAQDQVEVMQQLGFERFRVAGHDRGARAGFRMALDHPERVVELACIDILPTHHVWTHVSREWALNAYHWAFEDCRAGATIDYEMDTGDFEAGRRITCPLLVIGGGRSHTSRFYSWEDAWSQYATNLVRCIALPSGHYPAEQAPDETGAELSGFFGR